MSNVQPNIRLATLDDIPSTVALCLKLFEKTPYHQVSPDATVTTRWAEHVIRTGIVILADEDSLIGGIAVQFPFSTQVVASELVWGTLKEGKDAIKTLKSLLEAFEYWGRNVIHADAIQIGSFHGEKSFLRRGYTKCETLFLAELK